MTIQHSQPIRWIQRNHMDGWNFCFFFRRPGPRRGFVTESFHACDRQPRRSPSRFCASHTTGFSYPQHPPENTCRCRYAFQQNEHRWTLEWVKSSTDSIRRSTTIPQSEQGPGVVDGELCSWTVMTRQLCIRTYMLIADCRHEPASLL